MISCIGIGTFTGSIFLIVLLFVAGDIDTVINSSAGPLLQILIHSTQNNAGAICLLMYVYAYALTSQGKVVANFDFRLPLVCLMFATVSVMTTSSRMIFAFARFVSFILSSVVGMKLTNIETVVYRHPVSLPGFIPDWACH